MTINEPASKRNLDGYDGPPIPWTKCGSAWTRVGPRRRGRADLIGTRPGLATTNPDGSPHVMPLGVLWVDGACYFNAGPGTRKARNLAADPRCVYALGTAEPYGATRFRF